MGVISVACSVLTRHESPKLIMLLQTNKKKKIYRYCAAKNYPIKNLLLNYKICVNLRKKHSINYREHV